MVHGVKTICVAGGTSRAGKTAFAARLLARLPGWAACKVTTCLERAGEPCPRGREGCGVCGSLEQPFEIDEDTESAAVAAKDTGRLRTAGASRVLWVRTRPEALSTAVGRALEMLGEAPGVVLEGNHVLEVLDPDVAVMVLAAGGAMKKSARDVKDRVDIFADGWEDEAALGRVLADVSA